MKHVNSETMEKHLEYLYDSIPSKSDLKAIEDARKERERGESGTTLEELKQELNL